MDARRIDAVARLFADRSRARRPTPAPRSATEEKVEYLFVQSFQSGSIAAKASDEGTFALTLAHGLGQTICFSDRPERIVRAHPTARFLAGFPFDADNPPNAALVVDAPGGAEIAVVELTNPAYDEASHTATYDATLLADPAALGITVAGAPEGGSGLPASFGAAHLFIDDCPNLQGWCVRCGTLGCAEIGWVAGPGSDNGWPTCYQFPCCEPCAASESWDHLADLCNAQFSACEGECTMKLPGSCLL